MILRPYSPPIVEFALDFAEERYNQFARFIKK